MPTQQQKSLGQYFTVSAELQQFVFDKVKHKLSYLLEPSFGAGHLLQKFKEFDANYPIVCYELDTTIKPVVSFNEHQTVVYGDFTKASLARRFKTIVGNPPYVKQRTGNLYIQFVELCYNLLDDGGELIFIVPSDFLKLTRAARILESMTKHGSFTDIWFPHDETLFDGASIDVMVFRYEKGLHSNTTVVNGKEMVCNVNKGIVTFSDSKATGHPIESRFHVYVGLVSGRDEIYKAPFGNVEILTDKDRVERFILPEAYPTGAAQMDAHLLAHKAQLLERKIRKFSESNWFEWGAPRNISSIRAKWGAPCIYVRTLTRAQQVSFLGTVQYFGGALLCLVPNAEMTPAEMTAVVEHLNSAEFQKDYMYAGRFKIGHRQISTAMMPPA